MLRNRLPYKFLILLLIFSTVLIIPLSLFTYLDFERMIRDVENIEPLMSEQKAVYLKQMDNMVDNIISYSFYIFIVAFIISMFFSHRLIMPVKELYRGAKSLRDGKFDIRLDVTTNDELGEVTIAFNDMVETLKGKTSELMRKDHYVNAMLDPLWVVDEDNIIIDTNPAFTRLFGYERDEVIGSSIFDFLDEEAEKVVRRKLYEREAGMSSSYETAIISRTDGLIPVLVSGSPIVESGEVVGKIGIIKDFRTQITLREAIKEEKEKSEAIMDSMVDHLLVIDRDYRIVKANLAVRISIGRDIQGENCHEILHGIKERCFLHGEECPVKMVFDTGKSFRVVHEHIGTGGNKVFHEIIAYPVKDKHGEVKHAVETMRDITERKKFEDEIELKNIELITLNSISKILGRSLRSEDIFNNVLDKVIGLVGMDGGGIYFMDEMGRELKCRFYKGLSDEHMKFLERIRIGDDIPGKVALTGQGMLTTDVSSDPRTVRSRLRHSGIKGFSCIPIRGKEKLIGVFFIFSFNSHVFTDEEDRTLNSISEMMGIAFENIRLYEKMRGMYEHNRLTKAEEQKNLLSLFSMLASSLDMKSVLSSSLSLIRNACRSDFCWLLDADEKGNLLIRSVSDSDVPAGGIVYHKGSVSIESHSIDKKEPVIVSNIASKPDFSLAEQIRDFTNACSLPMFIGDKTLGSLALYYRSPRVPTEDEIYFLQTVSSVLAVAMERARLYENVILQKGMSDTILESITDGVMTVDTDGKVKVMNSAAGSIIGIQQGEGVGTKISEMISFSRENMECQWKMEECFEAAVKGELMSAEANIVSADGRRLPLAFRSAPVRDNQGDIAGVVYILRDLSMEMELDIMKTDFVKSVSHEFRTPLTAIVGMAEMVLESEVDGKRAKDYLGTILSEGKRLSNMVSDVLDVASIESGKEIFRESEIDFKSLLKYAGETFEPVINKKGASYSSALVNDIIGYTGDEDKLKQLVRNLVDNSMTYSDKGCSVEVNVLRDNDNVRITVKDDGWGMEAEDLEHVGEKFYRGRHIGKTKGTGLGFSLCNEIVRMHCGRMRIQSEKDKGTTVTVDLPMRRGE
jgi:PAS domain S-box-containing protein